MVLNEIVTQNSRTIEAVKDSLIQITTILQQLIETNSSNTKLIPCIGPSIPQEVDAFALLPAKEEHIKPIIECESNFIGKGGFGTVYGGSYNGQAVAVKRLTQDSHEGELYCFFTFCSSSLRASRWSIVYPLPELIDVATVFFDRSYW